MKIHYLQHVPFENLANIEPWAINENHTISKTLLFNNHTLPKTSEFDWLIIMGGPMNIYEDKKYSWLVEEKKFIEKAIADEKNVLGICLGAQLITDVLGGTVYKNNYKEIGWHPVLLTEEAKSSSVFNKLPDRFIAFHWHGDTFNLPSGAIRTAESEGCANQAFEYDKRVIGLQFHLESSEKSINSLIQNCADDITEGKYVQKTEEILYQHKNLEEIEKTMNCFLSAVNFPL